MTEQDVSNEESDGLYSERSRTRSAEKVIKECMHFGRQLERFANLVLMTTIGNVTVTVIFLLYTIFKRPALYSSSWAREQYFLLLTLAITATISLLVISVLSLTQFQRISRSARIYVGEVSDSLTWYRKSAKGQLFTELKIALRELAGRSDLPLSSGAGGYLAYFALNVITVLAFVTFIALTVTNLPQ